MIFTRKLSKIFRQFISIQYKNISLLLIKVYLCICSLWFLSKSLNLNITYDVTVSRPPRWCFSLSVTAATALCIAGVQKGVNKTYIQRLCITDRVQSTTHRRINTCKPYNKKLSPSFKIWQNTSQKMPVNSNWDVWLVLHELHNPFLHE